MLVTFLTFAAIVAVLLIVLLLYVKRGSENLTSVPGLEPSHPEDGNLKEISEAGGFGPFLKMLHDEFGPIASFWNGKEYHVSIGGSRALKDITPLFDRPHGLFRMAIPLLGKYSIQTANGHEGLERHGTYTNSMSSSKVLACLPTLNRICKRLADEWAERPDDEHILIRDEMISLALTMLFKTQLGSTNVTDEDAKKINQLYTAVNDQMIAIMNGDESSELHQAWDERLKVLHTFLREKLESYKAAKESGDYEEAPLLEAIIEYHRDMPETQDFISHELGDLSAFTVGGFHTTGTTLFWFFYYTSLQPDIQEQVYQELDEVLGEDDLTPELIPQLKFTRQVIDETLRASTLAPFAARYSDSEIMVGGHRIPPKMPIVIAFSGILSDPEIYPDPEKFDPSRHSSEEVKRRPAWAFHPFGYGKRRCPGYHFANTEMIVALSVFVRRFRVLPADRGELLKLGRLHSLVTGPDGDAWFKLEKR